MTTTAARIPLSLLIATLATALVPGVARAEASTVRTDTGVVAGVVADGVVSFKAIPYAAPPVGPLRWRTPQPASRWNRVRPADRYGAPCVQPVRNEPRNHIPRSAMSEDCLTLNVFRPVSADRPRPVMVWIHGGGLRSGAASLPLYDGTAFARGGVVFVSLNYRLGLLGFFVHPGLVKENADGGRLGNYGLLDQIAALQWVQRNIAAFGGDPRNVTIFGESAGGQSVDALMISPAARNLFHKAISQSGYGRGAYRRLSTIAPDGQASAEDQGRAVAAAWGSAGADLEALRAIPAGKVIDDGPSDGLPNFYLDGPTLDDDLWAAFRAGREAPVPFLLGSNGFEFPPGAPGNAAAPFLKGLSLAEQGRLVSVYGTGPEPDAHLVSDITFTGQARALARLHARNGHPTYLYLFDVVPAGTASKGAAHAAELRYVFDALHLDAASTHDDAERGIATTMNAQWRAFAERGNPSGERLPHWPRYDGQAILEYTLGAITVHPDKRADRLDALAEIIDPRS